MSLTDVQVRAAKLREKPFMLVAGYGLYLLVQPNGSKLWRMKHRVGGKEKKLAFGKYGGVPLKTARSMRD